MIKEFAVPHYLRFIRKFKLIRNLFKIVSNLCTLIDSPLIIVPVVTNQTIFLFRNRLQRSKKSFVSIDHLEIVHVTECFCYEFKCFISTDPCNCCISTGNSRNNVFDCPQSHVSVDSLDIELKPTFQCFFLDPVDMFPFICIKFAFKWIFIFPEFHKSLQYTVLRGPRGVRYSTKSYFICIRDDNFFCALLAGSLERNDDSGLAFESFRASVDVQLLICSGLVWVEFNQ